MLKLFKKSWIFVFAVIFVIGFTSGFVVSEFRDDSKNIGLGALSVPVLPSYAVEEPDFTGVGGPSPKLDKQDILDDIAEQLDIISQQVLLLQQQNLQKSNDQSPNPNDRAFVEDSGEQNSENTVVTTITPVNVIVANQSNNQNSGGGGGGPAPIVYPKILISEAQTAGVDDQKEEFVELYNPNETEIDLTGWYLQKKTSSGNVGSFATKTLFSGKKISSNAYFLIARIDYFASLADISVDNGLSDDSSLLLKNPNQEISDKIGWGGAQDYETTSAQNPEKGQSIGRKWVDDSLQDTENNFNDFEIQTPTPKTQNIVFVEPPKDITPPEANFSLGPIQNSLTFTINFTIIDPLATVTPSGIDSYIFRWKEESGLPAQAGDWQEDAAVKVSGVPDSADFSRDFTGQDGITYYFQVKAKDIARNESGWLPAEPIFTTIELPVVETKPILISEVQIEGQTVREDFIKFYNPNDFDVFLKDYRLVKRAKSSANDTAIKSWGQDNDAKILAKQYYLWASSTDENYPQAVGADSFTKQNISDDNGIALRRGEENIGEIIDAVGWGDFNNVLFEESSFPTNPGKNQKLIRKIIEGNYQDTNNNFNDFEILEEIL